MISAILSKLLASFFKTVSYGRFLKLAIGCLDVSFCLLSGLNLTGLIPSVIVLFRVGPSDQWLFLISLFIRELVIIALLCLVFEKRLFASYKPNAYRCIACPAALIVYVLMKYMGPCHSPVLAAVLFYVSQVDLGYIVAWLMTRLYFSFH